MILPCLSRLLSRLPSVRNIFLLLRKNNERILTKFAGGKQHHEQVKLFWAKLEQEHGSRIQEKIRVDINRFCRDVKQLLTPSE